MHIFMVDVGLRYYSFQKIAIYNDWKYKYSYYKIVYIYCYDVIKNKV